MTTNPLKVLSVCTSLSGGAGRAAHRIHQGVRGLGVDSRMLLKNGISDEPDILTLEEYVPVNPFYKSFDWVRNKCKNKIQHYRWNQYPHRDNVYMSDLRGTDLCGVFGKLDYDILHLHWINQRFVSLADLPKDKPIVWTLHDSWPFCGVCHYFFDCEQYKKECRCCPLLHSGKDNDMSHQVWLKKAEIYKDLNLHIVTPSRWLGECARQSRLLERFPVTVIPNCLDVDMFRPLHEEEISSRWRKLQRIRLSKPLVLFGAMNATKDNRKGFPVLLSALKRLEERGHKDDFEVVVFGASESDLEMNVDIPIHYVGYVKDTMELVSLYNLATVMVVPSITEAFGQTASEALSCETPVIAFKSTGIQEVVSHKIDGYLAMPYESEDLANGVLWCLNNNKDNHLGIAARRKIKEMCSPEVVGEKYKKLYERVFYGED